VGHLLARARFEVIPLRGVDEQVAHLPPGTTVTVTCSPRKGIGATLEVAERLARSGYRAVPHISARLVRSGDHVTELMGRLTEADIGEIFVIGGDLPEPEGPYPSALSLLRAMAETGRALPAIGVGAYPERHPLIEEHDLLRALLEKQAFATSMVTQICFDAATIVRWLTAVRTSGITLPVHVGMPGILKRRKLLEISLRVGVGDSVRYLTKHGSIVARLIRRAGYRPDALVATVSPFVDDPALGIEGFHINTFNQVEGTERWRRQALGLYGGRTFATGLERPIGEVGRDEHGNERGSAS
jgi:methylenetetrahydrofolate reductase (NADPH)